MNDAPAEKLADMPEDPVAQLSWLQFRVAEDQASARTAREQCNQAAAELLRNVRERLGFWRGVTEHALYEPTRARRRPPPTPARAFAIAYVERLEELDRNLGALLEFLDEETSF